MTPMLQYLRSWNYLFTPLPMSSLLAFVQFKVPSSSSHDHLDLDIDVAHSFWPIEAGEIQSCCSSKQIDLLRKKYLRTSQTESRRADSPLVALSQSIPERSLTQSIKLVGDSWVWETMNVLVSWERNRIIRIPTSAVIVVGTGGGWFEDHREAGLISDIRQANCHQWSTRSLVDTPKCFTEPFLTHIWFLSPLQGSCGWNPNGPRARACGPDYDDVRFTRALGKYRAGKSF